MDTWAAVAFFLVTAGFLGLGIRNILWSLTKEQIRFRSLVTNGLARSILNSGLSIVVLGGLVAFAARTVPHSVSWQILGIAIVALGCIGAAVAKFGSVITPSLEQMPEDKFLLRRVAQRRLSGVLLVIGGLVWVWNGVPNAT